jgi:steroid delta-isomerase
MSEYEKAVEIADTYMAMMSAGDFSDIVGLYTADASLEDPVGSDVLHGADAIGEFYNRIKGTDLTCTRTGPVCYANREMVFPFECAIASEHGSMVIQIIDHFVLDEEDKIKSMRAFWSQETTQMK